MLGPITVVFIGLSGLSTDEDYDDTIETGVSSSMLIHFPVGLSKDVTINTRVGDYDL